MEGVLYKTECGRIAALLLERGRKYLHIIPMDSTGIRIRKVKLSEEKFMTILPDYPIEQAKEIFKRAAAKFNEIISQEVLDALS